MAAITTAASPIGSMFSATRTADATTRTDWLIVPGWAKTAFVFVNFTVVTTSTLLEFFSVDPVGMDDANIIKLAEHGALTALTGAATVTVQIGPGVSGIADDVTIAATGDSAAAINSVLPPILGVRQTNTGASTYTLAVTFRK